MKKVKKKNTGKNTVSLLKQSSEKNFSSTKKNVKVYVFVILTSFLMLLLFTISYSVSFFNYTRTGDVSELLVGKIYMHYNTSKTISFQGVEPRSDKDLNTYIEFTIDGLNEYKENDIWYAIDLIHGDVPDGKNEENRIRDDLLRFTLTKSVDGGEEEIVLENESYTSIIDERIYVEKIAKNTTTNVNHTYKLYVWISDSINVGNMQEADYSVSEWDNLFASVKVRVVGDFEEKGTQGNIKVTFDPAGGTVNQIVKYYSQGEVYGNLPIPERDGYSFVGWTYNGEHVKSTDIVRELGSFYELSEDTVFTGSDNIITSIKPFTEENSTRNFYVAFEIKEDNSTASQATIINAKLEDVDRGYPGFLFRRISGYYEISAAINSKKNIRISTIPLTTKKVELLRLNQKLYYRLDNVEFIECFDFGGFDNYFDVPIVIGSSITASGNPQRYFIGTLSNVIANYIEDDATFDDFEDKGVYTSPDGIILKALWVKGKYEHFDEITFDGTNYIDTDICLFCQENINRNFYMAFEIVEDKSIDTNATAMSSKNENGDPWPGFDFRHNNNLNYYYSKATSKKPSTSGTVIDKIDKSTKKVRFLRIDNKLYYSFDSDTFTFFHDFTGYSLYFNVPVTFGASYSNNNVRRYFRGKLRDIVLEFINDEVTVADYEKLLKES